MNNNTTNRNVYKSFSLQRYFSHILLLVILSASFAFQNVNAQGSLLLTPKRIVFEGNKKSESINLANSGKDTAQYVISLVHFRMKEDGAFEEISKEEAGQFSAEPYIRYFPRVVTLAPNEGQVIRIQFNKSSNMATGEYRSHLYVRALPKSTPLGEKSADPNGSIGVKLVPVFGISLPIIIKVGESSASVNISEVSLKTGTSEPTALAMTLNRTGNMSVYGDILVKHIAPNGVSTLVGTVKGVAVYSPNASRTVLMPLDKLLQVDRRSGKLVVQFIINADSKAKEIAQTVLTL